MLNTLIAVMSSAYDRVASNGHNEWLLERAKIILEIEQDLPRYEWTEDNFPMFLHVLRPKDSVEYRRYQEDVAANRAPSSADDAAGDGSSTGAAKVELGRLAERLQSQAVRVEQVVGKVEKMERSLQDMHVLLRKLVALQAKQ